MAESPNGGSIVADTKPDSDGSNKATEAGGERRKTCKGYLFYSSDFKADSRSPRCVGITGSVPKVSDRIARHIEEKTAKYGGLVEFRYTCVGYSVYKDRKDQASTGKQTPTEYPFCIGVMVLNPTCPNADTVSAQSKGEWNGLPQKDSPKPTHATGDEFLSRFTRSANQVANGVAKNIRRVGNQIKQSLDDIMSEKPK